MFFLTPTHPIRMKVKELSNLLKEKYGLTTLTAVEQELRTTPTQPIDVEAFKAQMKREASERLHDANTDEERLRAQHMLDALPHAKTAEHLFNIAVYDTMHDKLEFRGTPEIHGVGYYDMEGNVEFRTKPIYPPEETASTYAHLLGTILKEAKRFGLKVKWRGEQLNLSIWRGDQNLTSVASGADKDLSARILMGMLETNEDVRPLMPRQLGGVGKEVRGGPTRLDAIRIVNHSPNVNEHRFEQRDDFKYDIMLNVSHRMLMMLDGAVRGLEHPEYAKRVTPIRAVYFKPKDRNHIEDIKMEESFRVLSRLELDAGGNPMNVDALFKKRDTLLGHGVIGETVTQELTGKNDPLSQARMRTYFKAIRFTGNSMELPQDPPDFKAISDKITAMHISDISVHDSLRFEGVLLRTQEEAEQRVQDLRARWGNGIVDTIATTLQKGYRKKTGQDHINPDPAQARAAGGKI